MDDPALIVRITGTYVVPPQASSPDGAGSRVIQPGVLPGRVGGSVRDNSEREECRRRADDGTADEWKNSNMCLRVTSRRRRMSTCRACCSLSGPGRKAAGTSGRTRLGGGDAFHPGGFLGIWVEYR
jgi:hypothetical protein